RGPIWTLMTKNWLHDSPSKILILDETKLTGLKSLCEIHYMDSDYYLAFLTFFLVNLLAILILARGNCGLSKGVIHYLICVAAAVLMVIITDVIFNRINNFYIPISLLSYTHVCSIRVVLVALATKCSVWFTVAFTFDRFVAICHQKLKTTYCTVNSAIYIIITLTLVNCAQSVPWYFVFSPLVINNDFPFYCTGKPSYYALPIWRMFTWFNRVFTPLVVFLLISLFNALTIRHILLASRTRRRIRTSFILLWMSNIIYTLKWSIANYNYQLQVNSSRYVLQQTGFMLKLLSSCTNTFIYAVTQTKFREDLKYVFRYPFTLIYCK
uniref:G-protein coupled receptors family 1 profile domain-containing protein n=1 Tax=Callorhinchus milii TaxID=7868 RepID=A0A4W3IY06_CALMI